MDQPIASTSALPPLPPTAPPPSASVSAPPAPRPTRRPRKPRRAAGDADSNDSDSGPKALKLKMGAGARGGGGGGGDPSGVGWDRELDSDEEEPLVVEEQFLLRVPPAVAPRLREMVETRNVGEDVWFKFKDSRRAVFHLGDRLYGAKLVDLPTLLESQKMTGVGGQSVKVADVSQMLLVEDEVDDEAQVVSGRAFNIEDFIYPHGITAPLKHVRKRRFRRRVNKRTIETVENAVEQLLEQDARADEVHYELLDNYASDDEYGSPGGAGTAPADADLDSVGAPTPRGGGDTSVGDLGSLRGDDDDEDGGAGAGDDDADGEEEEEQGSGYDSDLANEINKGLEALNAAAATVGSASEEERNASGSENDGDGLFGGSSDDEDDDDDDEEEDEDAPDPETLEQRRRIKLLAEETGDLERAIATKEGELASKAANPIFKKRFEEMIRKLTVERDLKKAQHATALREMEKKKKKGAAAAEVEEVAAAAAAAAAAVAAQAVSDDVPTGGGGGGEGDKMDES